MLNFGGIDVYGSFMGVFFQGRFGFRSVSWVASATVDRESFSGFMHHQVQRVPPKGLGVNRPETGSPQNGPLIGVFKIPYKIGVVTPVSYPFIGNIKGSWWLIAL